MQDHLRTLDLLTESEGSDYEEEEFTESEEDEYR